MHWHILYIDFLSCDASYTLHNSYALTWSFVVLKLLSNLIWKIQLWLFSALYLVGTLRTAFAFKIQYTLYQSLPAVLWNNPSLPLDIYILYTYADRYKLNGKLTKRHATHLTYIFYFLLYEWSVPIVLSKSPTTLQSCTRTVIQFNILNMTVQASGFLCCRALYCQQKVN